MPGALVSSTPAGASKKVRRVRSERARSFVYLPALVRPDDHDSQRTGESSFESDPRLKAGLGRLLATVEEFPLRYAPFFGRLAALWDLGEDDVPAALVRAQRARGFRPTLIPGVRRMPLVGGSRLHGAELALLELAPGARFPRHRHEGHEAVLTLEGSYHDAGRDFEPGDAQEMPPGSMHALRVGERSVCVAAIVSRGFAFTSLPLRLLQLVSQGRR
jgi:quercetin dioxygenase-like cupin family protein